MTTNTIYARLSKGLIYTTVIVASVIQALVAVIAAAAAVPDVTDPLLFSLLPNGHSNLMVSRKTL